MNILHSVFGAMCDVVKSVKCMVDIESVHSLVAFGTLSDAFTELDSQFKIKIGHHMNDYAATPNSTCQCCTSRRIQEQGRGYSSN